MTTEGQISEVLSDSLAKERETDDAPVFIGQNQQSDVRYVISGSTPLVRPNR